MKRIVLFLGLTACGDSQPTEPNGPAFDLRSEYWALICNAAITCPSPAIEAVVNRHRTQDECLQRGAPDFINFRSMPFTLPLVESGALTFKSSEGQSCLEDLQQHICRGDIYTLPTSCKDAFVGTKTRGGSCQADLECGPGLLCKGDGCDATCQPACGSAICKDDEYCLNEECLLKVDLGEICRGANSCVEDLVCSPEARCVTPESVPELGPCNTDRACEANSVCVAGLCRSYEIAKVEEPCGYGVDGPIFICEFGTLCREITLPDSLGRCLPPAELQQICQWPGQCGFDLTCTSEMAAQEGECQRLQGMGDECTADRECLDGRCVDSVCTSDICE